MASARRAEADEILSTQLVERAQQVMLVSQPSLVLCDDRRAVGVLANPERIALLAAATDIDGADWSARMMLVENLAHRLPPPDTRCVGLAVGRGPASDVTRGAPSPKRERPAR